MIIPFATQSYQSSSLPLSAQRCINAFAEKEPPDAKTPVAVFNSPGIVNFATCGTGPIRGMHVMNNVLYVVSGPTLYRVSSLGAATALGGVVSGTNRVSMADNGTQLCIVNGVNGYIYSPTIGFVFISDANFHAANTVIFFDNVFVFDWAGTNKFFVSTSLDGTTYPPLGFGSAEVSSDFVLTTINQQETLYIFGTNTIELWYDAGALNMPFVRIDGGVIERGCSAMMTPIKEDNAVFFLGDDIVFYRLNGVLPQRVSTHAIEAAWQKYPTVGDAYTYSYTQDGHKFIVLSFPDEYDTWVYDISTGLWHERESWDMNWQSLGIWRANSYARCYNLDLVGDAFTGQIGYLDRTISTEYGNTIRAMYVSPPIHQDRKRMFCSRFELDIETGVGLSTGQGSDPQFMLDISHDGGRTFGNLQSWQSMGQIGAYHQRLRWTRLGQGRTTHFRITCTDPVKRVVLAANADFSVGM